MTKNILTLLAVFIAITNIVYSQTKYSNDDYGFKGLVSEDWHIYAEIKNDGINNKSIIDWGLPKVYSELEKTSIENAVSITAYKRADINSLNELVKFEFKRIGHALDSKELIDSISHSYMVITIRNGLKYKGKVTFSFQNNVGYILSFTATPGTYDINLPKFDDFVKGVKFFEPKKESKQQNSNEINIRFDGLYIAKTGEINIPNKKMEIYTYVRFYKDGSVYTQAVSSYDPEKVAKWLGKDGRFERKGVYKLNGVEISFTVSNDESPDKNIEGAKTDIFNGKITDGNKLFLEVKYDNGKLKDFWFEFIKTN